MENIFNNGSWKIESGDLPEKKLDISNTQKNFFIKETKLKYLNSIFFDEVVRIDIKLNGNMVLMLNDTPYKINTSDWEDKCLIIKNWNIECDGQKISIPKDELNNLNLIIESNTIIDKFTIVQDQTIDNCNPMN